MSTESGRSQRLPVFLAAVGLLLSLWLEVVHVRAYLDPAASSFCSAGAKLDCVAVALSRYAVVLGVPLPALGVAGFLALLLAALRRSRWILPLSAFGALASAVLLAISLLAIGSLCLWCEVVHVVSWVLFGVVMVRRADYVEPLGSKEGLMAVFPAPAGLLLAVILFAPPYWRVFTWKGDITLAQGVTEDGAPWIGAAEPKLTIEEYTDYSCPFCAIASSRLLRVVAKHPNEIRVVRRQFPRLVCFKSPRVCQLARLAYCAGEQGRFWHADRWLFANGVGENELPPAKAAEALGLDLKKLEACLERDDIYARAAEESKAAKKRRVLETPTYFIEGTKLSDEKLHERLRAY